MPLLPAASLRGGNCSSVPRCQVWRPEKVKGKPSPPTALEPGATFEYKAQVKCWPALLRTQLSLRTFVTLQSQRKRTSQLTLPIPSKPPCSFFLLTLCSLRPRFFLVCLVWLEVGAWRLVERTPLKGYRSGS